MTPGDGIRSHKRVTPHTLGPVGPTQETPMITLTPEFERQLPA